VADSTGVAVAAASEVEVESEEEVVVVVRRSQGASITRLRSAIQASLSKRRHQAVDCSVPWYLRWSPLRAAIIAVCFFASRLMKTRFVIALIAGSLIATGLYGQDPKPLTVRETVDSLVAKNTEAKGGAEALRSVQTLRLQGKMIVNQGRLQLVYLQYKKRPGETRAEFSLQGMTQVVAFDGTQGWKISPFGGRKDPEKMSADDTKSLMEDAEIEGPLVDWKAKGSTVEYLGTEDVDGTAAHKLKVVRKNGDVNFVYLDPDHFLEIRIVSQRIEQGAQIEVETDLGDYEKIGGVFIPFSIEAGDKGSQDKQKIVLEKGEANVPVDEALFKFPTTPSK
jgi:hypothetical protein